MNSSLVKIGRPRESSKNVSGPQFIIVDKFFLLGALSSILGSVGLGVLLWLALYGIITLSPGTYPSYRRLHSIIQIYLFLGSFILGFSFHAIPRVVGVNVSLPKAALSLVLLLLAGGVLAFIFPEDRTASIVIALPYLICILYLVWIALKAKMPARLGILSFVIFGLIILFRGLFILPFESVNNVTILSLGLFPVVIGAGQQFIQGFFGGRRIPLPLATLALLMLLVLASSRIGSIESFRLGNLTDSLILASVIVIFYFGTNLHLTLSRVLKDSLAFVLHTGVLWMLVGTWFFYTGEYNSDFAVHSWALGFFVPLIMVTSTRIVSHLSGHLGKDVLTEKQLLYLVVLWQLVPIERALRPEIIALRLAILTASLISTSILGIWAYTLCERILRFNR